MLLFNSFQFLAFYVAMPFLIVFLDGADLRYADQAWYAAIGCYIVQSLIVWRSVFFAFKHDALKF